MTSLRSMVGLALCVASSVAPAIVFAQATSGTPPATQPPAGRGGGGANARARAGVRNITLTSPAFADGGMIPAKHAQAGRDVSPPLAWSGAPDSVVSYVLIVHDADAPIGDGNDDMLHWMVWGIPGTTTSLPEGVPQGAQSANGWRQISGTGPYYRGAAAPSTGPAHHYVFELYALDINVNVQPVGMSPPATRAAVVSAMANHIRGKGVLVGLYKRPAPSANLGDWPQHSRQRPLPPVVNPGPQQPVPAPNDAISLFDGKTLTKWMSGEGERAKWKVVNGAFEVVPKTGTLTTRDSFGDVHLHIEWRTPKPPVGKDQDRGNSGVFFGGGRYEVQVLDSYDNVTYADGQAASVYGQYPPTKNVSLPPGEWQTYDIVYHRPRFDAKGALVTPCRISVTHNGVVVQDNVELVGPTANGSRPPYEAHADRLPISLQDHGHPVQFRNVWLHDLEANP